MSLIKPEAVFAALARMVGATPEQLQRMLHSFTSRFDQWDAEIRGFKQGAGDVVTRFETRMNSIEMKLDALLLAQGQREAVSSDGPINGKKVTISNEQHD